MSETLRSRPAVAPPLARGRRRGLNRRVYPYLLVGPAVIYLTIFMAYPMLKEIQLSFTNTSLLAPNAGKSVGARNYQTVFTDPEFLNSVWITFVYAFFSVVGALVAGLLAAIAMNTAARAKFLVRSVVMLPWAAPAVAVALIWVWMFNGQYGVINYLLSKFGIRYQFWLDSESLALPSLIVVTIWMSFPVCALILLAAMQSIPKDLYEAARIDKASRFNQFTNVTVPGIRPTLYLMTLLLTIWALRRFDTIWVMTQGGPVGSTSTVVVNLYDEAFQNQHLGLSAAMGIIGLVVSTIVTVVYFFANRRADRKSGVAS